jgi:hypothetical protein
LRLARLDRCGRKLAREARPIVVALREAGVLFHGLTRSFMRKTSGCAPYSHQIAPRSLQFVQGAVIRNRAVLVRPGNNRKDRIERALVSLP